MSIQKLDSAIATATADHTLETAEVSDLSFAKGLVVDSAEKNRFKALQADVASGKISATPDVKGDLDRFINDRENTRSGYFLAHAKEAVGLPVAYGVMFGGMAFHNVAAGIVGGIVGLALTPVISPILIAKAAVEALGD